MSAVVTCPECRSTLRLPQATPEGRVRCPRCRAVFAPVIDAEVDASESVAVVLDEPADPDRSFFERVAEADNPLEPPQKKPFEEVIEAEAMESPAPPLPAKPKRIRPPEPKREPARRSNLVVVALVALIGLVLLGGAAGASFVVYHYLTKEQTPESASHRKSNQPADESIPSDVMAKAKAATVLVRTQYPDGQSTASAGFFVAGPGMIVTNARSVGQGSKKMPALKIAVNCGPRTFAARILGADSDLDLALLQVAGLELPEPLPLTTDTFTVREPMPLVVFSAAEGRVVTSNVSVTGTRPVFGSRGWFLLGGVLPQGAWGGPVTDDAGKVVGVSGVVGGGEPAAVPAEAVWSFVQSAAKSAEGTGGIAFAAPDSGRKTRDDWDDGFPPGMVNPWRGARPPIMPPGWDGPPQFPLPQPILPPGFDPNFPQVPRMPRERR